MSFPRREFPRCVVQLPTNEVLCRLGEMSRPFENMLMIPDLRVLDVSTPNAF